MLPVNFLVGRVITKKRDDATTRRLTGLLLAVSTIAFVLCNGFAIAKILHNNRLEHYAAAMDPTTVVVAGGAGVLILAACWFARSRLRPHLGHVTWYVAWSLTTFAGLGSLGMALQLRPLWGSDQYDAAVKEFGDTFVNAAKLTDEQIAASKLISRVSTDTSASRDDILAAIDACDTLIKRLTDDASFLESWPQVCREIMRAHGVSEKRVEWYARRMEQENDTSELLESNAQLAVMLQARKLDLRGRLVAMEQDESGAMDRE